MGCAERNVESINALRTIFLDYVVAKSRSIQRWALINILLLPVIAEDGTPFGQQKQTQALLEMFQFIWNGPWKSTPAVKKVSEIAQRSGRGVGLLACFLLVNCTFFPLQCSFVANWSIRRVIFNTERILETFNESRANVPLVSLAFIMPTKPIKEPLEQQSPFRIQLCNLISSPPLVEYSKTVI